MDLNLYTCRGRVRAEPELRKDRAGVPWLRFLVATQGVELPVVVKGRSAERELSQLKEGKEVGVVGSLRVLRAGQVVVVARQVRLVGRSSVKRGKKAAERLLSDEEWWAGYDRSVQP